MPGFFIYIAEELKREDGIGLQFVPPVAVVIIWKVIVGV